MPNIYEMWKLITVLANFVSTLYKLVIREERASVEVGIFSISGEGPNPQWVVPLLSR